MASQIPREVGRIALAIGGATGIGYILVPKILGSPRCPSPTKLMDHSTEEKLDVQPKPDGEVTIDSTPVPTSAANSAKEGNTIKAGST